MSIDCGVEYWAKSVQVALSVDCCSVMMPTQVPARVSVKRRGLFSAGIVEVGNRLDPPVAACRVAGTTRFGRLTPVIFIELENVFAAPAALITDWPIEVIRNRAPRWPFTKSGSLEVTLTRPGPRPLAESVVPPTFSVRKGPSFGE